MKNNTKSIIWNTYIFGCIILILKLFIIDIDTPPWEITQYSPIDEYYYVLNAYNYFEQGNLFGADHPVLFGNPALTNFITYFSLEVFGDNYLGLRFSSFLFGLLSYSLIFVLLKQSKVHLYSICAVLLFTVFNFTFSNASYIVEPSILGICSALFSVCCIVLWKRNASKDIHIIGQATILSTLLLFSYPTNAFVLLAAYILLVFNREEFSCNTFRKERIGKIGIRSIYFGLGVGLSLVVYYGFNRWFGIDLLENSVSRSSKYSNRLALNVRDVLKYFLFSIRANIFVINPLLLLITGVTIYNLKIRQIKQWPVVKYISFIFLLSFFLQSLFINDFPVRKLILFFPFIIILIGFYLDELIKKSSANIITFSLKQIVAITILAFVSAGVYYKYSRIDFIGWIILFIGFIVLTVNSRWLKLTKANMLKLVFVIVLIPELFNALDYHIINRTYSHKHAEQSLERFKGSSFLGGYSMGFRGYNEIESYVTPYYYYDQEALYISTIKKIKKNNKIDYSIDYKENEEVLKQAGFEPFETLMHTQDQRVWVIYKEKIVE